MPDLNVTYVDSVTQVQEPDSILLKDLNRIISCHFSYNFDKEDLINILSIYSNMDSMPYFQGMSYIAAALLSCFSPTQSFMIFSFLFRDLRLKEIYQNDFSLLTSSCNVIEQLIHIHLPLLDYHFSSIGLESSLYLHEWLLSLFSKFPKNFFLFSLNSLFEFGTDGLIHLTLAVLKSCPSRIFKCDLAASLIILKQDLPLSLSSASSISTLHLQLREVALWSPKSDVQV